MKKIIVLILTVLIVGCNKKYIEGKTIQPTIFNVEFKEYNSNIEEKLDTYIDSFINDKDKLVSYIDGKEIKWEVVKGNAYITDNIIYKTEKSKEYENISLKAIVDDEEYTFDNIELIDEYVGYLMTYFTGDGLKKEKVYYAWTYNGTLWYQINFQKPVLNATIGTRRLRDPSIIRRKNGKFTLIATEGFDNPDIYAFDSDDLVKYENERLIKVNKSSDEIKTTETQAWAPEGFYDRRIDKYVIYWSSPNDEKMFFNYSSDLEDISYPKVFVDVGFPVIDGTILKEDFGYSIALKDERKPMEKYSKLFVGYSDTDYRNFKHFNYNFFSNHQSEGPFIIKRDYDYILYYDDYTRHKFKAFTFYELKSNIFEEFKDEDIISSIKDLKHASAIPLTWKEFERISKVYDTGEN